MLIDTISMGIVRTLINQKSIRELPGNIPFAAHEDLDMLFLDKWGEICLNSIDRVVQLMNNTVQSLCKAHFGRFNASGLLKSVR